MLFLFNRKLKELPVKMCAEMRFIMNNFKKQEWKPGNMLYPVPAVMVSCAKPGQKPNIITVAWAGTICSDPVMLSISVRKERFSHEP